MISHEETAKIAFELYEKNGRVEGCDQEHWFQAERILSAAKSRKNSVAKPAGQGAGTAAATAKRGGRRRTPAVQQ